MRIVQEGSVNTRPNFSLGQTRDKFRVIERRKGDVWISILLHDGGSVKIPDFEVEIDGGVVGLEDCDITPRSVYLSPDRNNIVIEKHIDSTTNVGNIYRRHGSSARMIRINGLRFDEACVQYYCRVKEIPLSSVTSGGRDFFPMAWKGNGIAVFDIASSNWGFQTGPGKRSIFFRVEFDFAHHCFLRAWDVRPFRHLITIDKPLILPQF